MPGRPNDERNRFFSRNLRKNIEKSFKIFYSEIKKINFPIDFIKKFYLFNSNRWDLTTKENQTIKLPIKNYISSLENFFQIKDQYNFRQYKSFDYRITNQLILK